MEFPKTILLYIRRIKKLLEAPNAMRIVAERPSADERRRYKTGRHQQALRKAASLLWVKGVPMADAIEIVESAMKNAGDLQSI